MKIDLRTVPFFYLNGRPERRAPLEAQLRGFIHERVDGTPSPLLGANRSSLRVLAPLGHARLIEHAVRRMRSTFKPFVLLEDDVKWRVPPADGPVEIAAPDYADAVYLGISRCACQPAHHDHNWDIVRERVGGFPHLQRVYNMLSAHAVLFLSFRHAMAYAQAMVESCASGEPCDALSCRLFAKHEVFALGEPLMYQHGEVGGQEWATNIAWTDDGTVGDRFAARRYHQLHPYSTGLEPLKVTTTIALLVESEADIARLRGLTGANVVVFMLARRLYQAVRDAAPDAVVLFSRDHVAVDMLRDLVYVNPHNTYHFAFMTSSPEEAEALAESQHQRRGIWRCGGTIGGDLDSLLAYTAPGMGVPRVWALRIDRADSGYVVEEIPPRCD